MGDAREVQEVFEGDVEMGVKEMLRGGACPPTCVEVPSIAPAPCLHPRSQGTPYACAPSACRCGTSASRCACPSAAGAGARAAPSSSPCGRPSVAGAGMDARPCLLRDLTTRSIITYSKPFLLMWCSCEWWGSFTLRLEVSPGKDRPLCCCIQE
jgi:hypothetical protein